jgi:hypothetical protein
MAAKTEFGSTLILIPISEGYETLKWFFGSIEAMPKTPDAVV